MSVLKEILTWSKERPRWQRDALRRLVVDGELSEDDFVDLSEICKSTYGLAEPTEFVPLTEEHVPAEGNGTAPVSLHSIFHHRGVNALAEGQSLTFSPNLTVVYGDNAAGKTGYIRILKSACRARGQEDILGNVVSGTAPLSPSVSIKYRLGSETESREWSGDGDDAFISRVSVFDTQSASVYLTEKTDVAFRPFGLDLFDKLVRACKSVRARLEGEQLSLAQDTLAPLREQIPVGTAVSTFLSKLSSLTDPESARELAKLTTEEVERLDFLEKALLDIKANDPEKLIQQLLLRSKRVEAMARHLEAAEKVLASVAVDAAFQARGLYHGCRDEAQRIREATFAKQQLDGTGSKQLDGTGSERWTALWEAARQFSEESAYPGQPFPVVDGDAQCVFCQQDIEPSAGQQLQQFQVFISSSAEAELRRAKEDYERLLKTFTELKLTTESVEETLKEIRIEHEAVATAVRTALYSNEMHRQKIVQALAGDGAREDVGSEAASVLDKVNLLTKQLEDRAKTVRESTSEEVVKALQAEAQELRARKMLATHLKLVLDEILRKRQYAAYGLCIEETKTRQITEKSTAVTKSAVSTKLKMSFRDELKQLEFQHVAVELSEVGGSDGVFFHKLAFTQAPGVPIPRVVSEGEQRCLSIAAFFAELSTADEASGIVFDDPVSSLDYKWREAVARRLVLEARTRQVIVFTHDVVFLLLLKQIAEEEKVEQTDQHVRRMSLGAGICAADLPWVAMATKKRIKYLKNAQQDAAKLHRDGNWAAYEKDAAVLYGLLREAWERALEEVLLGGIVERYRPGVQTKHIKTVADISEEDCHTLEVAMTKCSKWLPGHDQAPGARAEVPGPEALKTDIETLETWVAGIHKRRS